jgi:hypothetical protein
MHKNYTPDTLLLYVYKELPPNEIADIRRALQTDSALAHEFHLICESMEMLGGADMQPSNSSIEIIMEHSSMAHETTT